VPPADDAGEHGITMWGASSTGKTTFLAALSIALIRARGPWRVRGADTASATQLTRLTTGLTKLREFPPATAAVEHYRWELVGTVRKATPRRWRWLGLRQADHDVTIPLDLVDAPGEAADQQRAAPSLWDGLIENMVRSKGIVFFYDPVREFENGDAFAHTFGVLTELSQRMRDHPGGRLPHYVAVVIAKFDEIRVFETAAKLKLIELDADDRQFPRVPDDEAKGFFEKLCDLSRSGDADMVLSLLEQTFRPERIRYYVSSAIGFYLDPHLRTYDRDNYQNHLPPQGHNEPARIRGSVYPINVVEPILWLGTSITGEPGE
jgi:Double-GTPase 2